MAQVQFYILHIVEHALFDRPPRTQGAVELADKKKRKLDSIESICLLG